MRTRGAVIMEAPGTFEVVELELDDPRSGEIQVRMGAAGLCHSDDHVAAGHSPTGIYPFAGGHEGAGTITKVGTGVDHLHEGDRVVFAFIPSCGRCRYCASGQQNLCQLGATLLQGSRLSDASSFRLKLPNGQPVGQMCGLSTFCEFTTVAVESVIKLPDDIPLELACLLSCGVTTGWGSAVNSAQITPGDVVIVMGVGGIGINAVQGARHAGAAHVIAVDPTEYKRTMALQFGATQTATSMVEAAELARVHTNGQGADKAIVAVGFTTAEHVAEAVTSVGKSGTVVITGLGSKSVTNLPLSLSELTLYQKRIQGSLFGGMSPHYGIPLLIELYRNGQLKLDGLITKSYPLDHIGEAYRDMHAGRNIRGVIAF